MNLTNYFVCFVFCFMCIGMVQDSFGLSWDILDTHTLDTPPDCVEIESRISNGQYREYPKTDKTRVSFLHGFVCLGILVLSVLRFVRVSFLGTSFYIFVFLFVFIYSRSQVI